MMALNFEGHYVHLTVLFKDEIGPMST